MVPRSSNSRKQFRFRLLAIGFGLMVSLSIAVFVLRWYQQGKAPQYLGNYVVDGFEPHPYLGYAPKADTVLQSCKVAGHDTIYCATYTIDGFGRRQMPVNDSATLHLMFFGCSFTYGEGVRDTESFTYQLGLTQRNFQLYNYAYSGYGPQHLLAQLQFGNLTQEISQSQGTLMYMLMPEHVYRASGAPYYVQGWGSTSPHYALEADSLVYYANHTEWRPAYTYWHRLLGWSGLGSLINGTPSYTQADIDLTIAILVKAKATYLSQFPDGRFIVGFLPAPPHKGLHTQLANGLYASGIQVWDAYTYFPLQPPYIIEGDGHLNANGHLKLANALASFTF